MTDRKRPTTLPGGPISIATADLKCAPEVIRMEYKAFSCAYIQTPVLTEDHARRSRAIAKSYDDLFLAKLHADDCSHAIPCPCPILDMRVHGHWYTNTRSSEEV